MINVSIFLKGEKEEKNLGGGKAGVYSSGNEKWEILTFGTWVSSPGSVGAGPSGCCCLGWGRDVAGGAAGTWMRRQG